MLDWFAKFVAAHSKDSIVWRRMWPFWCAWTFLSFAQLTHFHRSKFSIQFACCLLPIALVKCFDFPLRIAKCVMDGYARSFMRLQLIFCWLLLLLFFCFSNEVLSNPRTMLNSERPIHLWSSSKCRFLCIYFARIIQLWERKEWKHTLAHAHDNKVRKIWIRYTSIEQPTHYAMHSSTKKNRHSFARNRRHFALACFYIIHFLYTFLSISFNAKLGVN